MTDAKFSQPAVRSRVPKPAGSVLADATGLSGLRGIKRIEVSPELKVEWDVAELVTDGGTLTGGGKHFPHHYICSGCAPLFTYKAPPKWNRICAKVMPDQGKDDASAQRSSDGVLRYPDISVRHDPSRDVMSIYSVCVYAIVVVYEAVDGAFPVPGQNVVIDNKYGVRGLREFGHTNIPTDPGYFEDVAANLERYKNSEEKEGLYWWVEGSTLRHEQKHLELYVKWFEPKLRLLLKNIAATASRELQQGQIKLVTLDSVTAKVQSALKEGVAALDKPDTEKAASAVTRQEFWDTAAAIRKWGAAELARKAKPSDKAEPSDK
jgi:hypothetical protein